MCEVRALGMLAYIFQPVNVTYIMRTRHFSYYVKSRQVA